MNKRLRKKLKKRFGYKKYNNEFIELHTSINDFFELESTKNAMWDNWRNAMFYGSGLVKVEWDKTEQFPKIESINPYDPDVTIENSIITINKSGYYKISSS